MKKFKDSYKDIVISKKLEENIMDLTVNKKTNMIRKYRLGYVCCLILSICFVSLSIVYADEIKQGIKNLFESWSSSMQLEDGTTIEITENNNFKEIPNDIFKENNFNINYQELENLLGFNVLKFDNIYNKEVNCLVSRNKNGRVGRIDILWTKFIYESDKKNIIFTMAMLNKNADEGYILAFNEGIDALGGKDIKETYISNNLNVKVILYSVPDNRGDSYIMATFAYDDILYGLKCKNYSIEELKNIIEKMHL